MKRIMFLIALMTGVTAAFADCTFTDVIVRQHWPWNSKIEVEMSVAGTGNKTHLVKLSAYSGGTLLGEIPMEKPVECDSRLTFAFDSMKVACLKNLGAIHDFRIVPSARQANVLYLDINLNKEADDPGQITCITDEDIAGGKYGEYVRQYWPAGADEFAWTGVAADSKYKMTHLVMRRIPAGTFKMGSPATEELRRTNERLQAEVTLTEPYYIGVFEVTEAQRNKMSTGSATGTAKAAVGVDLTHDAIRGDARTKDSPYDWPRNTAVDPNSLIGKFRVQTGIPFDLPTEAQWEKAARAGTDGVYYDGTEQVDEERLDQLAWYANNGNKQIQNVGLKKPNNYGLYDTLGNAMECVLDCYIEGSPEETVDPVGPLSAGNDALRLRKGGQPNWGTDAARLAYRLDWKASDIQGFQGFRLAMPAQW